MDENNKYLDFIQYFEKYISDYTYSTYFIKEYERVYLIEDFAIEFIYTDSSNSNRIVIEEIFDDGNNDLNIKKFLQKDWPLVQLLQFYGYLGESSPFIKSRFKYVNQQLPQLNIQDRYQKWEGKQVPYIVFELTESEQTGYAVCQTNAKQTPQKVLDIGNELMMACILSTHYIKDNSKKYVSSSTTKYSFVLDQTIIQIMLDRASSKTDTSWRKKNLGGGKLGFEEKGMTFFWINAYIKGYNQYSDGSIIEDIKKGRYVDVDKYEYVIPENKWKSEQLVYELAKQLYPKYTVFYQYRPEYLKVSNSQLSYDVYIAKKRVAIEYQGKQHFEPVKIFGGEEAFEKQKKRDELKRKLSVQNNIKLVYINYWENITPELLKEKIEN